MEEVKLTFATEEVEKDYNVLIEKIRLYHPTTDLSMVASAYQLAADAHSTQMRQSGEPYIIHPLRVAIILAELELDLETIAAMWWKIPRSPMKILSRCLVRMFPSWWMV